MEHRPKPLFVPSTIILLMTGCFHLGRGATSDGLAFLIAAALLVADAAQSHASRDASSTRRAWRLWRAGHAPPKWRWLGLVALLLGIVIGSLPRFGSAAEVIVVLIGAPIVVCAWMDSDRPTRSIDPVGLHYTAIVWTVVGMTTCLWELSAFLIDQISHSYYRFPTLSNLVDPLLQWSPLRMLYAALWVLAGLALIKFRRTH